MESEPQLRSQIHNIQSAKTIEECTETLAAIVKDRMLTDREEWDVNDNMDDIGMEESIASAELSCRSRQPACEFSRVNALAVGMCRSKSPFSYLSFATFETHMTAGGLALARAIGESKISPIVWTNMSV